MNDLLLLLLGQTQDDPVRWGSFSDGRLIEGGSIAGADGFAVLSAHAAHARTVAALLPGEQAAARRMPSAPRGAAKLRAAAAYLMEDELGESANAVTVAVAAGSDGATACAARRAVVDAWMAAIADAGFECDILSADFLTLPSSAETATLINEGGRIVAAFDCVGFAVETELFTTIARDILKPPPIRVHYFGDPEISRLLPAESALERVGEASNANVLAAYAAGLSASAPANFVQRRWLKRREIMAMMAPWRRAGAIAASLTALLVLGAVADGVRASRIADRWRGASEALHREYFPDEVAADPAAFARRRLGNNGSASFADLAGRISQAVAGSEDLQIDRIRFNAARGEFMVSVTSTTDSAIEDLKSALAARGVVAEDAGGYRNNGEFWSGELTARTQ